MKYSIYLICIMAMLSVGYHYTIQEPNNLNDDKQTSLSKENTSNIIIEVVQNETIFGVKYNKSFFGTKVTIPMNLIGNFNFLIKKVLTGAKIK